MNRHLLSLALNLLATLLIALLFLSSQNQAAALPRIGQPGGTFIVTSSLDNNIADNVLTLREAILLATGGTGPTGVNRELTYEEANNLILDCTYYDDNTWIIIGDCGAGYDDFIVFSSIITYIQLPADLPPITDTGITTINGLAGSSYVTIDGAGAVHGFDLQSNHNVVQSLSLTNMKDYAVRVSSDDNLISNLIITHATGSGIIINGGSGNHIFAVRVGDNHVPCGPGGVSGSGIVLSGAATGNDLTEIVLRCNGQHGLLLDGTGTISNTISGGATGRIDGNGLDGISERNGATRNTWSKIPIFDNGGVGIYKSNPASAQPPFLIDKIGSGAGYNLSGIGTPGSSVEVYRAAPDPGGVGEGRTYLATAIAGNYGDWSAAVSGGTLDCFTAFQTVSGVSGAESSEFAINLCESRKHVYLPIVMR